jgi:arylsulfatase A-like enzyme
MERSGEKPWFIAVGFHRPHDPFVVPARYFDLYPEGALTLWRDPEGQTPALPLAIPQGAFREAFARFTDAERLEFLRAYAAGVSFMDAQVGRVLGAVDRLGLWGNTLVIFMGDNGYHLGERDWWNKDTLFERSTRVPLLVRPPAAKAAPPRSKAAALAPEARMRVSPAPVELVDLFPTVLDFASLPAPHPLSGRSLRPQLKDPTRASKGAATTVVVHGKNRGETVRTPEWRYTRWTDGTEELYDERLDPEETRNLAADPKRAALRARLQALLTARLQ